MIKRIVGFFFEIGTLRKIPRSHRQTLFTDDLADNISSHSHRVSAIAYFIAIKEGADLSKVLPMAIFHDIGESRSGDQNWIHKRYVKVFEDELLEDQFGEFKKEGLYSLMKEYLDRQSLESKVVKDADKLDQFLLVQEYKMQGNQEALKWINEKRVDEFYSETAKSFFLEICNTNPSDWWKNLWVEKRR